MGEGYVSFMPRHCRWVILHPGAQLRSDPAACGGDVGAWVGA